ncbi:MAG: molybdopterin synthase sulfur carrier subunit [Candidatus Marinimicrobia bacterium]|nr:molybdopterin synthase sulfur carrier subunit [Candidatus Neomarinimicrobiota bacterium]
MKITVKCFSQVRYALEKDELSLELVPGKTTKDVEDLVREHANKKLDGVLFRTAVNRIYIKEPRELKDGDEVAFIPPVQGG